MSAAYRSFLRCTDGSRLDTTSCPWCASYENAVCNACVQRAKEQAKANEQPGAYYVTALDDSKAQRVAFLIGPFSAHARALAAVDFASNWCRDNIPDAAWWAFGTARYPASAEPLPRGKLNAHYFGRADER